MRKRTTKSDLRGQPVDPALLKYLSPLGWEKIHLTGDYQWNGKKASTRKIQVAAQPKLSLACSIVRFLTGPLQAGQQFEAQ